MPFPPPMQVFLQKGSLYAFKGLAGRLGPIGVHAALLLVLGGTSYSGFGGFKGSVMTPEVRWRGGASGLTNLHPFCQLLGCKVCSACLVCPPSPWPGWHSFGPDPSFSLEL